MQAASAARDTLLKASTPDADRSEEIASLIDQLDFNLTPEETDAMVEIFAEVAADTANEAWVQVGLGTATDDVFEQFNARAREWASQNVAELVSGVSDTTRDQLRKIVTDGFDAGQSKDEIADEIEQATGFSDTRAELIARTEIRNANSAGALNGLYEARDAGVNVKKTWVVALLPCVICLANEAIGPIALEIPFPSGDLAPAAHPRCRCALGSAIVPVSAAKAAFICN